MSLVFGTAATGNSRKISMTQANSMYITEGSTYRCIYSMDGGDVQKYFDPNWKQSIFTQITDGIARKYPNSQIKYVKIDDVKNKVYVDFIWYPESVATTVIVDQQTNQSTPMILQGLIGKQILGTVVMVLALVIIAIILIQLSGESIIEFASEAGNAAISGATTVGNAALDGLTNVATTITKAVDDTKMIILPIVVCVGAVMILKALNDRKRLQLEEMEIKQFL